MSKYILAFVFISLGSALYALRGLPDFLSTPPESTQVLKFYDRHGIRIKSYAPGESYDWISLAEVPDELKQLVLLAEDKNFYQHNGVDFTSSFRSGLINLRHLRVLTGASTLTQQVYRIHHQVPRTWWGKIQTMAGAFLIERKYSKDILLSHYLNSLPYGKRLIGVKRASEVLFGKSPKELSLSEMAVLAVAPRSPSYLLNHWDVLKKKRDQLLETYAKTYSLRSDILAYEMKTPVALVNDRTGWDNYHYVKRLMSDPDLAARIVNGGVETTLDSWLQKEVAEIARSHLRRLRSHNARNSAVIVLENSTGDVLAYLGSSGVEEERGGHIDALLERRQPGSALKPFTYALALEKGMPLTTILPDIPSYYKTGKGQYLPRNYDRDFSGPRLMRESLANSLNLPAVALADQVGVSDLFHFLKKFRISLSHDPSHYGVGLTLGNAEISPVELVRAYTAFSGKIMEPRIYANVPVESQDSPMKEETAFLIKDVLSDPIARSEAFGRGNIFELPFEFSAKTGTSTDFRDNWAVGMNRFYTVLVWVGNVDQEPMKKVSGISGAGPILTEVFSTLMKDHFVPKLVVPSTLARMEICALSGKKPGKFCPHKKMEYIAKVSGERAECDYHQEVLVRSCQETGDEKLISLAVYPDEYQHFALERPLWTLKGQVSLHCPMNSATAEKIAVTPGEFRIRKPLSGSIYAIDPNIPNRLQKLEVQLNQSLNVKKVSWKFDQNSYSGDSAFDWVMEKGQHEISATVELENGDVVATEPVTVTVL